MQSLLISDSRISTYKDNNEYVENIKVSQHFYPMLNCFEIALRNKINNFYIKGYGVDWLITPASVLTIDQAIVDRIGHVKERIAHQKKPVTNDNIVANLSLGFWVELFNHKYLIKSGLYKEQVCYVFGISKKNIHKEYLIKLHNELNTIRDFRNRIFHYERIINHPKYSHVPNQLNNLLYRLDSKNYIGNMLKQLGIVLTPPSRL